MAKFKVSFQVIIQELDPRSAYIDEPEWGKFPTSHMLSCYVAGVSTPEAAATHVCDQLHILMGMEEESE